MEADVAISIVDEVKFTISGKLMDYKETTLTASSTDTLEQFQVRLLRMRGFITCHVEMKDIGFYTLSKVRLKSSSFIILIVLGQSWNNEI